MSRCGGCDLCWPNGKENFGVSCQGDCEVEEYASNLNSLVSRLRSALESAERKNQSKTNGMLTQDEIKELIYRSNER